MNYLPKNNGTDYLKWCLCLSVYWNVA